MSSLNLELYQKMYLIRQAEKSIQKYYAEDQMKTPMHMSMGEEAVVTGVVHALSPEDQVCGTYRSHALYIAKTGETDRFFAEMYGKETGMARGKSGSMHLSAPDMGLLCCSAIVASGIPVAMGAAFANKYLNNGKRVAVFFGDGATDEGVFWESVNFACLKKLPIIFVCEDNGIAVHTARSKRHGFSSLEGVSAAFDCNFFEERSTEAEVIYATTKKALAAMQENGRPCIMRLHYYRYLEHVGINEDFHDNYRCKDEYLEWLKVDPILSQREKIAAGAGAAQLANIEQAVDRQVEQSIRFAEHSGLADASELHRGVFSCA